ncbi:hypothetical protein N7540_011855 [Penicillium herquei]|nr:hypothetical protein N7540_011855 [Penicillium herquei]
MEFVCLEMKRSTRKAQDGAVIASFFFNARGEYLERWTVGKYRSLLLQLLEGYPDLQAVLDDFEVVPRCQNDCPSLIDPKDLFWNGVTALGQRRFKCFVDGLDECDEQIKRFPSGSVSPVAIIHIWSPIRKVADTRGSIRAFKESETYINSRLRIPGPALAEELQLTLLSKAAGVFTWAVLVVDILNREYQRGGLAFRKRIAEMPSDLGEPF